MITKHFKGVRYAEVMHKKNLMYTDILGDDGLYKEVEDEKLLLKTMQEGLEDYNAVSQSPLHLVLFVSAVEHVLRVGRIIRQPFGNALLVGVGGSGRQSATRLATHLAEYVQLITWN